jgi:hypothetical protein
MQNVSLYLLPETLGSEEDSAFTQFIYKSVLNRFGLGLGAKRMYYLPEGSVILIPGMGFLTLPHHLANTVQSLRLSGAAFISIRIPGFI